MNLHNSIMNIRIDEEDLKANLPKASFAAYKVGHRDARHAAAELSLKAEARIEDLENEYRSATAAYNAVIEYILGKGFMESPMEFLRCWNQGNFEALREEWPDAPEEIYLADPLYKGDTK